MFVASIFHCLKLGAQKLQAITDCPMFEAEILLAYVLKVPRSYLHAHAENIIMPQETSCFFSYILRRSLKEPLAYITERQSFWSFDLKVTAHTLIPRPETEQVVEMALKIFPDRKGKIRMLDLGTGSGAIALALASERSFWEIVALDKSNDALLVAKENARVLKLHHIEFVQKDWNHDAITGIFDLIVANPPYLSAADWEIYGPSLHFEPRNALFGGQDGLSAFRSIMPLAVSLLKQGGYLILEHGFLQAEAIRKLLHITGYSEICTVKDLSNQNRVTVGRILRYNS